MKLLLLLALVFPFTQETNVSSPQEASPSYPPGDMRNCQLSVNNGPQYRMEVLPGGGFDNLRNLDMGLVHAYNYSLCQISPDGKYLLPDNVFLIPLQQSKVELNSEYFDHWNKYTDMTASSINAHGGFGGISGKFSAGYKSMKSHQYNQQSKTARTQARYKVYTVKLQPAAQLHPTFRAALHKIAMNIENNNTEYASYLAQLLVRDYGTHYVTSVEAGAIIAKTDYLNTTYTDDKSKTTITASASASFFGVVNVGGSYSHTTTTDHGYNSSITHSEITSYGGPPFQPIAFSFTDWEKGIPDTLVAIDRSGEPLYYAINSNTLPELPDITVQEVADTVEKEVARYYRVNTRGGCTDAKAPNFNFQANVDDKSCKLPNTNFSFGGVYQTCENGHLWIFDLGDMCAEGRVAQKNPLTGDYSCPEPYQPILLHSGFIQKVMTVRHCWTGFFSEECRNEKRLILASYKSYWCAAMPGTTVPQQTGYLFGGFYTSYQDNMLTEAKSCPKYYLPLRLLEDVMVCVSGSYEAARDNHINFGGFESCTIGNPLAIAHPLQDSMTWPHACPAHFTPQLVTVDGDCEVNFCIHKGAFSSSTLFPVKLPPFHSHPKHKQNTTHTVALITLSGEVWLTNKTEEWYKIDTSVKSREDLLMEISGEEAWQGLSPTNSTPTQQGLSPTSNADPNTQHSPQGLSTVAVAAISVVTTLAIGTLVLLVVWLGRKLNSRKNKSGYSDLHDSNTERESVT